MEVSAESMAVKSLILEVKEKSHSIHACVEKGRKPFSTSC
jgi:hypothetical protein